MDAGRGTALFGEDGRQALLSFWVACLPGYLALPPPALFPFVLGYAEMRCASCKMQGIQTGSFVSSCESLNSKESCLQGCHGLVLGWEDGMY